MGIISVEKSDHLYWLGRYMERVYTTLRKFYRIYDHMIEEPEGAYSYYCERLNIPNIYTSNENFVESYLFGNDNPDSLCSNMRRAYDNAIVLREEVSTKVLSYVQLCLDIFEGKQSSDAPLLELQDVLDYILAFWGCVDDYVENEECRNIIKCGKYVERVDLYLRLEYHTRYIEKEYSKLLNRIQKTGLSYDKESLDHLTHMLMDSDQWQDHYEEVLVLLGGIIKA